MQILSNSVSSDVTNTTPEATKPVKSAKQLAAAAALTAMSAALAPERGVKAKAHREAVAANKKETLGKKLGLLTAGNFEHKGKRKTLNVRQTLIEMVKAARVGATAEQLALTGVAKRFTWSNIEPHVRAFAAAAGEHAAVVLAVLYPEAKVEAPAPEVKSETKASAPKADKQAAKPAKVQPPRPTTAREPVKKTG